MGILLFDDHILDLLESNQGPPVSFSPNKADFLRVPHGVYPPIGQVPIYSQLDPSDEIHEFIAMMLQEGQASKHFLVRDPESYIAVCLDLVQRYAEYLLIGHSGIPLPVAP